MAADKSLEKLVEEIKSLRGDFSRISESVVGRARQQTTEAAARVRHAAEDTWSEAKGAAAGVAERIEDQPLAATAIAFGIGMLLGMLLTGAQALAVRSIFARIGLYLIVAVIVSTGIIASFAFFCLSIYASLSDLMSPPLAALVTGFAILIVTFLVAATVTALARTRRRPKDDTFASGLALGAMFAEKFRSYAEENPRASFLMSLIAGFMSGANR